MDNLMQSLSSMIKPDMVAALGKAIGADTSSINQGLAAVGPLAMGSMAKMASTPGGAESLLKMLPQGGGGALGNIGTIISGLTGGGSGGGMVNSVMGPGVNAIGASLSKALGFNVTPLLGMVVPVVGGLISKAVKSDNLDAAGLQTMLSKQSADFANDPANKATMALVNEATAAGEKAAAQIASYGADWSKVAGGPAAALLLVAASDLSGPFDTIKEVKAADAALRQSVSDAPAASVMSAAFGGGLTESASQVGQSTGEGQGRAAANDHRGHGGVCQQITRRSESLQGHHTRRCQGDGGSVEGRRFPGNRRQAGQRRRTGGARSHRFRADLATRPRQDSPQFVALNLSGRRLRQCIDELDPARPLVVGEAAAHVRDQFVGERGRR